MRFRLMTLIVGFFVASAAMAAPRQILCLGDSLTEGYGVAKGSAYPELVEAALHADGYKDVSVVNAGVSGSTTASGLSRLKWHLKTKTPDILFLELGGNDGLRGVGLDSIKKNLTDVVMLAKSRGVPAIMLAGMMIPPNYGKAYAAGFAQIFPDVAKAQGVKLLPFLLVNVAGDKGLNQADGIHPTAAGHQIVAKTVTAALKPLLGAP